MPIRPLPPVVAAGIAAGEVIERPASVVKELVENSIDAGATTIHVDLHQGGLQLIRVSDDGSGIDPGELELAFERHATSKIEALDDLDRLRTMGFRGEALASIAAAARVRLTSRPGGNDAAALIEMAAGQVLNAGPAAAAPGTTVEVEALFESIPARLKFMRSPQAETTRIKQVLDHLAMAAPQVRFELRSEDRLLLQTPGTGDVRDVAVAVYGATSAEAMLDVRPSHHGVHSVHGLVSPPDRSRPNRSGISIFINGRWITSRTLTFAVEEAYAGLLMEGRFPFGMLFVDIPPDEVDVNVHPNKREVRFLREGDAFSSIQRAVRETLLAAFPVAEARGLLPHFGPAPSAPAPAFAWPAPPPSPRPLPLAQAPDDRSQIVSPTAKAPDGQAETEARDGSPAAPGRLPELRVLGQVADSYIVAEGPDGMYLIDQHAAHESVLYYRLLKQWETQRTDTQPMLDPLPLELDPEQSETAAIAGEVLARYGLQLEAFGGGSWLVRAVPAMARQVDPVRLVSEALSAAQQGSRASDSHLAVAASLACHSAVRAGQALDMQEMEALSVALRDEANPQHCPHGRPTTVRVATAALDREFGRT